MNGKSRIDSTEIPAIRQIAEEHDWFSVQKILGMGPSRIIEVQYDLEAFAWCEGQHEPALMSGPWKTNLVLQRGMCAQPLVHIVGEYIPVSANISDFAPAERSADGRFPGLVCYAGRRWDPTRSTLGWVVFTTALIITGQAYSFEAKPLSPRGRAWQNEALGQGLLPTQPVSQPRNELLYLCDMAPTTIQSDGDGIEFDER